ncbi:hypothetical protein U5B43_00990 [Campylobacter sp. 9BO]|uniref:fibronectin type III domain-containing protein n=1 Tax=Campylobacter sp. 9BO TaxID=3424759 RepID=UPI003D32F507
MKKFVLALLAPLFAIILAGCGSKVPTQQSASLPTINNLLTIADTTEIGFEWTPINDENVLGYYLYRLNPSDNKFFVVGHINDRYATHYVDRDLAPETTYSYQIRSYSSNAVSPASQTVKVATKPLLNSVPFVQAINGLPNRVKLIWRPHPDNSVISYVIKRADAKSSDFGEVAEVKGRLSAEFIDQKVKPGNTYRYTVHVKTAQKTLSKPSEIVTATTKELP